MKYALADEIIRNLRRVQVDVADQHATVTFLADIQRLRGFLDALETEGARRLHELCHNAPAAAAELAKATQRHARTGDQIYRRAATLTAIPSLTQPLQSGRLQAAHVDTVTTILRTIDDKHRHAFTTQLPELIDQAATSNATPDDLARTLNRAARALENDDGTTRFTQQRRDTALHTWTDKRTGMFRLSGRFDPLSGMVLHNHLQAMIAALFAERVPSTCPTDPGAKQDHLRALALLALVIQQQSVGLTIVPNKPSGSPDSLCSPFNDTEYNGDSDRKADGGDTRANDNGSVDAGTGDDLDEWATFFRPGPSRLSRPEIVVAVDARQETVDANRGHP